jgi:long-chain fatty acid transport protein
LFEVDWANWSRFHELRVNAVNPAQPDDVTVANWKDSWLFAVGAEFQPNEQWTFRAGVALDESPVPSATLEPRVPDADRTWVSAGFTYHASANIDLSATVGHLFLPDRNVSLSALQPANQLRGNLTGKTSSSVNVIGLQFSYRR